MVTDLSPSNQVSRSTRTAARSWLRTQSACDPGLRRTSFRLSALTGVETDRETVVETYDLVASTAPVRREAVVLSVVEDGNIIDSDGA